VVFRIWISRNLVPAARRLNAVLVRVRSVRDGALSSSWDMKGCSGWMFCFYVISGFKGAWAENLSIGGCGTSVKVNRSD